jgi:parallel beta-helix repeat protein
MDKQSYRPFYIGVFLTAIIGVVLAVHFNCVLGYEEIITFDINSTYSLDNCSRIMWYPDIFEGNSSPPALRSGPIRNSGISCVKKVVEGPANINFLWKIDQSKNRIGELSFNVDNETILVCPSSEWSFASYAVSPGRHLLSWVYKKQRSYPEFDGAGWIDDIRIIYENGTQQILTKPEDYINDTTIGLQLVSLRNRILMIEGRLDSLRNITDDIVFIPNGPNVNLTNEINKYKNKIIVLDSDTYHTGRVVINTSNIYIMSRLKWNTVLDGDGAERGIFIHNSRNVTLDSLVINDSLCSIRIDNSSDITIRDCLITGFSKYGIRMLNSNNSRIEGNRFTTTYCNAINALNIFNGSNNIILANTVDLLACGDATTRISYVLNNSSENFVQVLDDGYIRDDKIKCQFKDNKYLCQYNGLNITADLVNRSTNTWSFLSYMPLNNSGV